jgi:tetratricopeptide (TPR) repeat protein
MFFRAKFFRGRFFRAMSINRKLPLILFLVNAIPVTCLWLDHRDRVARNKTVADCIDVRTPAEAAIAACSDVINASPKAVWAYTNRGLAYSSSGDQDRAIDDLDMAIGLDRGYARAYAIRATAFNGKGNWDRGIVDLTKAIELNPGDAQSYSNRAAAYMVKGKTDLAIADTTRAIALNPRLAPAYDNRAVAYEKSGRFDLAIADYRSTLAIEPRDRNGRDGLKRLSAAH